MGDKTAIGWTSATWNPIRGCTRVSEGCRNCFAEKMAARFCGEGQPYEGLAKRAPARWTGDVRFLPDTLWQPLRWTKPRRIFVNSMSDLFHDRVSNEQIAAVFGVMAAAPQHTFQVLTKQPDRMLRWFEWAATQECQTTIKPALLECCWQALRHEVEYHPKGDGGPLHTKLGADPEGPWPVPNVHLGVSVEDQATADERIPFLLETPATVRFISLEPMIGNVDLRRLVQVKEEGFRPEVSIDALTGQVRGPDEKLPSLDWVIVGGESGPGARPCAVEWVEGIVRQCRDAGTPCFVKQLGAHVFAPWKLAWTERINGSFDLFSADRVGIKGSNLATVYPSGHWHTWDANGTGGENDTEPTLQRAKEAAIEALSRQHAHPYKDWAQHRHMLIDRKGADPGEWPSDLRVQEFPEASHG